MKNFSVDTQGATAIEYALIAGLVSIVIVAGVGAVGTSVLNLFTSLTSRMP